MPLLALMVELHVPASGAENILPISLHRLQARASVRTTPILARVSVSRNVPWLIDCAAGLSASFHSKDNVKWFIYT